MDSLVEKAKQLPETPIVDEPPPARPIHQVVEDAVEKTSSVEDASVVAESIEKKVGKKEDGETSTED